MMGIGGALFEAIHFVDGRILNPHLADYRVPRFSDMPQIDVEMLDRKDLPPAGAGETPIMALAPAISNAVFAATQIRLRALPMVPGGLPNKE
jgi:isoquinoline 1-oxidoreductase